MSLIRRPSSVRRMSTLVSQLKPPVSLSDPRNFAWKPEDDIQKYWSRPEKGSMEEASQFRTQMERSLLSHMDKGEKSSSTTESDSIKSEPWTILSSEVMSMFHSWLGLAYRHPSTRNANGMCLSTLTLDGPIAMPSSRMVLLKMTNDTLASFIFFSHLRSHKGKQLSSMNTASLTFYWDCLDASVRIQGIVNRLSDEISDDYWASRPRGSQLCSAVSEQSSIIGSRTELDQRLADLSDRLGDEETVKRPEDWVGFQVLATSVEFWISGEHRWHHRLRLERPLDSIIARHSSSSGTDEESHTLWTASILQP